MLNPIKVRSEELTKRVTIQKAVRNVNERGVILYEYPADKVVHNVCASIESYSAFIRDGTAEKVAELEFRITIRYRAGLNLHDRIVYQGRVFEQTIPAKDINEQHQFLQLTCREKVITNGKT